MIAVAREAPRVGITGLGAHVPGQILSNARLGPLLDASDEWIHARTGVRERRIAEPEQASSDLAVPAALAALAESGADARDVDLVIVATASPDMLFPSTASLVAAEIGAVHAAAYDLSAACTGFVYALAQGHAAVAGGLAQRVLVVGAETLSRFVDWQDRSTCILFGDGAGAAVLERVDAGGFLGFELGSDGARGGDICLPAGGSRLPPTPDTIAEGLHTLRMRGQEVFRFSTRATVESAERLLEACGLATGDIDLYAPHQANARIIDWVVRRLDLRPETVVLNIGCYGNTSAASIPLALDEARQEGRLASGSTVLMTAVGAGLTWGSALLRWTGEDGA